ncbi:MAG: SemiSWEET family transporter [Dehalococcoidia bacterium]
MNWLEALGFLAGLFITVGIIPQVWRLFQLKSAREISLSFTLLFLAGGLCWLIYGIAMDLLPLIIWNAISVLLMCLMLFAKIRYGKET